MLHQRAPVATSYFVADRPAPGTQKRYTPRRGIDGNRIGSTTFLGHLSMPMLFRRHRSSLNSPTASLRSSYPAKPAVDRLTQQIRHADLCVRAVAGIAQVVGDALLQSEAFIQLADQNQPRVRRDMRSLERDLQQAVECELKRTVFFFTHGNPGAVQS